MEVLGDDQIRPRFANLSGDVQPELAAVLQLAVLIAEEFHPLDPKNPGRASLFDLADAGQAVWAQRRVAGAPVTVGDDHVRHLTAISCQLCHSTSGPEVGVVRVGNDDQHSMDLVLHAGTSLRPQAGARVAYPIANLRTGKRIGNFRLSMPCRKAEAGALGPGERRPA